MARKHREWREEQDDETRSAAMPQPCWLCGRPLGEIVEWHHPLPKSRGGRETVAVHPVCHQTIHSCFSNSELARLAQEQRPLTDHPDMERFLRWIANKPADFHAPTRKPR